MKIVGFGASTSKQSINKRFANYALEQLGFDDSILLDLNDYPVPLFSVDEQNENGIPEKVVDFYQIISSADVLVISMAEHNGSYTAAFKNLFDWVSRHQLNMFENVKLVMLSTAPGPRGGLGVMEAATDRFPRHAGEIIGSFSLPKFHDNFNEESGITDEALSNSFDEFITKMKSKL